MFALACVDLIAVVVDVAISNVVYSDNVLMMKLL